MDEEIKELQSINQEIENKTELLEMTQSDEETARNIQGDIITMENHLRRVRQLGVLIEDLQATLGAAGKNLSHLDFIMQYLINFTMPCYIYISFFIWPYLKLVLIAGNQ